MRVPRRLIALLGAMLCAWLLLTQPAQAQPSDPVSVRITAVSPEVLTAEGELIISGTVTNQTDGELGLLEVRLWRDATPLRHPDQLLSNPISNSRGAVMESPSARHLLAEPLAPQASVEFTVRAELGPDAAEQLWLSETDAAYRVGVQVFGWHPAGGYQQLAHAETLIAYPGGEAVGFGTVVLLNNEPSLLPLTTEDADPVFRDERLVASLNGRLGLLLEVAKQPAVTTVLDPALFDEVTALAGPHQILDANGEAHPGSAANRQLARQWLAEVEKLIAAGSVVRTVHGSVDLAQLAAAGRPDLAGEALAATTSPHPLNQLPLVVISAEPDSAELTLAGELDPELLLATALGSDQLRQQVDGLDVLAVQTAAAEERGERDARLLLADRQGNPIVQLISRADQVDDELLVPDWQQRRPLAELRAAAAIGNFWPGSGATVTPAAELIQASDRAVADVRAWAELVDEVEIADERLPGLISGAWSSLWGGDLAARLDWLASATSLTAQLSSPTAVQLRINDWVTTSADDNLLPVTLINNTRQKVLVRVHFESDNPLRIRVEDSDLVSIEPGESTTVRVRPLTFGNGKVAITAQLTTASGHLVGAPTDFVITGTEAGRVAWLIIVASGGLLLVATALRIRQVRLEGETDERATIRDESQGRLGGQR